MAKRKGPVLTIPLVHLQLVGFGGRVVPECAHRCPFLNSADGHRCRLGWQDRDGMKPGPKCVPGKYRLVQT